LEGAASLSGQPLQVYADLYPQDCLEAARAAFAEFCAIDVRQVTDRERQIVFSALPADPAEAERVVGEFLNYALQCSAQRRVVPR
jgi:hypothetical protein